MRAADITLHWAKAAGKGRWALFDPSATQRELARYALSAAMPGRAGPGRVLPRLPAAGRPDATAGCSASRRWCAGGTRSWACCGPDRFIGAGRGDRR